MCTRLSIGLAAATLAAITGVATVARATERGNTPDLGAQDSAMVMDVSLEIGEQKVLSSDEVQSYSEGLRGIIDVRLTKDASQFIIVALKPGTTTLLFLMRDGTQRHYRLTVTPKAVAAEQAAPRIEARDNVRLDFYFVQMNRSYSHQIGIGWPTSMASTFSASVDVRTQTLTEATAVISDQALPRLDMAQSGGWAKLVKQAAVITANGEKATFSGGGEVNIPVQTAVSMGVQTIVFGSLVEVEPRYDSQTGRIELHLNADISALDNDRGTGIPGRITSSLDTVVNLELGQSLILAGLSSRGERADKSGLPILSQIPIVGALFGTHSNAKEDSENIIIIVPTVVDSVSMQDRERLRGALDTYREFSGDIDEVDLIPEAAALPSGHARVPIMRAKR